MPDQLITTRNPQDVSGEEQSPSHPKDSQIVQSPGGKSLSQVGVDSLELFLQNAITNPKTLLAAAGLCEIVFTKTLAWTALITIMTQFGARAVVKRWMDVPDDQPVAICLRGIFALLYFILLCILYVFIFWVVKPNGRASFDRFMNSLAGTSPDET